MSASPERLRAMRQAVLDGNVAKVRLLLKSGVPADGASDGSGFLRLAAVHGHAEVFDALVAAGANLREPELLEWTVDGAGGRKRPSLAIVQQVVAATDPDAATASRCLRYACVSGSPEVVALLLARGADPNAADPATLATPLANAAERGHLEVVRLLLDAGADPARPVVVLADEEAVDGRRLASLVEVAERAGHPEVVALLRSRGR